ncbi:aldo/keto reductase [Microbacterium sp. A84]|uniref:aldo/keto reductase n=1 Tax=Microbacterium sp. A84 TaxID=3450715 RepID=UPI003F429665
MYTADGSRYDRADYRAAGASGLKLPALSLGLWHNFGDTTPFDVQTGLVTHAFDRGITHFDLANNYGPPYGAAETNFGRILHDTLRSYRDELIITSKAGYDMWPGPYGDGGSRKYMMASIDQSLTRLGLDYVDVFYSHRRDTSTPLEETMSALADIVHTGKALYVGVSNYNAADTRRAAALLESHGVPLVLHQARYSLLDRHIEHDTPPLLDVLEEVGSGCVVFSPLAQGLLTDRYLDGVPEGSRAEHSRYFSRDDITAERIDAVRALREIAHARGQSIAQLALAWVLRDERVTSAIIGASRTEQIDDNLAALDRRMFTPEESAAIDTILQRLDAEKARG